MHPRVGQVISSTETPTRIGLPKRGLVRENFIEPETDLEARVKSE